MGGIFKNVSPSGTKDTILPTILRVGKEEIEYWSNMTCFYDKNWEFDPTLSTVPISFMHITSVTEIISAQGAEKRVIVYEAPSTTQGDNGFNVNTSNPAYKNNLEVIMDNVIVQPKQYQMEVIIPDSLIATYHKQGLSRLDALLRFMDRTDAPGGGMAKKTAGILTGIQTFLGVVETATEVADLVLGAFTGSTQMATMNKNSVQAMASKGHVVLFKKWTGYDYSYGLITKIDISKKPSEVGVYRGSITFQETPILNITKKSLSKGSALQNVASINVAQAARFLNLSIALPFLKVTGVMDEAGAPNTKNSGEGGILNLFK